MDWKESLPEELQGNETINRYESLEDFSKAFLEQRASLSSSLRLPSEHSDDDQKREIFSKIQKHYPNVILKPDPDNKEQSDEFWALFGVPGADEQYEGPADIKGIPDELRAGLEDVARKGNLTRDQFKELVTMMDGLYNSGQEELTRVQGEAVQRLKNEWGMAFGDRADMSARMLVDFEDSEDPIPDEIRNHPAVQKMMYNVSRNVSGQLPNGKDVGAKPEAFTPDELKTQLADLKRSERYKKAMSGKLSPGERRQVLDDVMKIRRQLAGEAA